MKNKMNRRLVIRVYHMNSKRINKFLSCLLIILLTIHLVSCSSTTEHISFNYMNSDYFFKAYDKDTGSTIFSNDRNKEILISGNDGKYSITADGKEYSATISGTKDNYRVNVMTPENTTVFYEKSGNVYFSGGSSNSDKDLKLVSGFLEKAIPAMEFGNSEGEMQFNGGVFLFAIICIIMGVISFLSPKLSFTLSQGWKYKNVEPSESYLMLTRFGGIVSIVIGIILVCISFQ